MSTIKQAIEALENVRHHISSASIYFANGEADQGQKILGDAIRLVMETEAALAALRSMPAEPVAWGMPDPETGQVYDCISPQEHDFIAGGYTIPLYATPHTAPVLSDAEETAEFETAMLERAKVEGYHHPEMLLERNSSGEYATTWVRGAWIGWRAKTVDAAIGRAGGGA